MGIGTGLDAFGKEFPNRYFDVGIAEAHALTFSAGLAAAGLKPYVAIYSTFLQRGYDNIIHDIALQNLPVRMIIDRAGLAPSDGATHHGIFDVAFLSHIPGISIYSPVTYGALKRTLEISQNIDSPIAIRYPNAKENERIKEIFYPDECYEEIGVRADFKEGSSPKYVFITYGNIVGKVIDAKEQLAAQGIVCGIILAEKLKPFEDSARMIAKYLNGVECVVFVEEGIKNGGFSMICANMLNEELKAVKYTIRAIDDSFAMPNRLCNLYDYIGLSAERLCECMKELISRKSNDDN
jgi:1-deoxy-D-xylulose-5-phosphate synthase